MNGRYLWLIDLSGHHFGDMVFVLRVHNNIIHINVSSDDESKGVARSYYHNRLNRCRLVRERGNCGSACDMFDAKENVVGN